MIPHLLVRLHVAVSAISGGMARHDIARHGMAWPSSNQFVEQDMAQICAQEDHVARTGQSLSKSFLAIMGSDKLVVELRKWLDHVGHGMPHYTGWKTSKVTDG